MPYAAAALVVTSMLAVKLFACFSVVEPACEDIFVCLSLWARSLGTELPETACLLLVVNI